jgi:signal transduction histidine kinase
MLEIKSKLKFLQDNKQVIYSIAVMLIIPGIIIFNTLILTKSLQTTVDSSIQNKAVGIGDAINVGLADKLDSPEEMQAYIDNWTKYNDETEALNIFTYDGSNFKVAAGLDKSKVGTIENSTIYAMSWNSDWPYAYKTSETADGNTTTHWVLAMPLKDLQGQKQALLVMQMSADVINAILLSALTRSFAILIITIVLVILLLLGNSRLFEYSILYNKIKEVDQMKDEFISMASHELRTPITVIRGYISLIQEQQDKLNLDAETKENLSIINISTERLGSLVEDLLDVSRIEQGRLKMAPVEAEVWPIVEETVKEMKVQSDGKGLALTATIEAGAKSLAKIDKDRLKQVLINIIGNSIKYTKKGGVEVLVKNKDKSLIVMIKDTGIGMAAKEREHLFEKFYRIRNKETEDIVGTGLGLWITKQIVELMQGTISVDSMEGVGTQVTIELPLVEK